MSYTIKGEVEVQKGFGLPRHTTATRSAYTPPEKGYKVFDTDLNQEFTWNGTDWLASISSADIPDNTDYVDLLSDQSIKGTKAFTETLDINRSSSSGAAKIKFSEYNTSNAFNMALKTGILTLEHTGVFSGTLELSASHAAISAGTAVNRAEIKAISAGTGEFKFTNHGTEVLSLGGTGNWISTRKFQSAETVAGDDDTVLATKGYVESVANSPTLSIGDLTDVDITTNPPLAGYVISWNDTTSRFEPSIVTAADRVLKAGDTMTGDLKVLKSTPKLTLEGSVPTIAMVMPTTSLNIEQFGNTGRIRHTGEVVTTDVTFGSSGVTASGGPFRYETTVVDQAFNIPNILFTHATYVKKAGDTMTGTLSVNSLIELVTSSTGTAPIRFKYNTTTNGSAIYHRTQDDSLTFVKYDTGSSSTENQMRIVSDYIQGDSEFRSLVATTAGSDDSVLTTKDYVDSLAVDTSNFVTLDGDETLTGVKSFANNEFDVTLANGTKAIDVRGNDGFPGTYLNASDGVDDDSEIKVVPFVCSFTSENSTNNIFATMYTNAGGSGTCTVETTKNQTNISTRETANFQVRTTGVEVFVAGPGEFGANTSQFDIDANGFMYQKNGDTEFEFNDTTNKFVVELNDQTLITYTSSTGGQLDFGVKVTSPVTVDGDADDVLTTKKWVLDTIGAEVPAATNFVDLTSNQFNIAGSKTFTDDTFKVRRGTLDVIETTVSNVYLRGYTDNTDRETEVTISGNSFYVEGNDNDDGGTAQMSVSAGGSIQLITRGTSAVLANEARLNLNTYGINMIWYESGSQDTTAFDIDAGSFVMEHKATNAFFEFKPVSNQFSLSLDDTDIFNYYHSTPRFQFSVPVRATATVDADHADTLTTKQFVLDKIASGGSQPDYELVVGSGSAAYTLGFTPATAGAGKANMQVFVNGIKQIEGSTKSYTVSGTTLTFTTGNIPSSGDDVEFYGFG